MRLAIVALAAWPLAASAQVTDPTPRCSLLSFLLVAQHHAACSPEDRQLGAGLQQALGLYADYFARNSAATEPEMIAAISQIAGMPVAPGYDCQADSDVRRFHDQLSADATRATRTAAQHLAVDRPVDLDFDSHCFGDGDS